MMRLLAYIVGVVGAAWLAVTVTAGIGAVGYLLGARAIEWRRSRRLVADYKAMVMADLAQFDAEFDAWLEKQVAG